MNSTEIIEQYLDCLKQYYDLAIEMAQLPISREMDQYQQQVMEDLKLVSIQLTDYLTPSLKEK